MIKENCIYEVSKEKTSILGLWQDNKGKIYRDYISLYYPKNHNDFESKILLMFSHGEQCIFYRQDNKKAFILYENENDIPLTKNIQLIRYSLSFNEIKKLLIQYNGITIFKINNGYLLEVWQS